MKISNRAVSWTRQGYSFLSEGSDEIPHEFTRLYDTRVASRPMRGGKAAAE